VQWKGIGRRGSSPTKVTWEQALAKILKIQKMMQWI
jgi:hypothetical protein